jgi:hypothetical protein
MGTKEQVKKGLLSAEVAMKSVSKDSKTYRWCANRLGRKSAPVATTDEQPKRSKYRHKPRS